MWNLRTLKTSSLINLRRKTRRHPEIMDEDLARGIAERQCEAYGGAYRDWATTFLPSNGIETVRLLTNGTCSIYVRGDSHVYSTDALSADECQVEAPSEVFIVSDYLVLAAAIGGSMDPTLPAHSATLALLLS